MGINLKPISALCAALLLVLGIDDDSKGAKTVENKMCCLLVGVTLFTIDAA